MNQENFITNSVSQSFINVWSKSRQWENEKAFEYQSSGKLSLNYPNSSQFYFSKLLCHKMLLILCYGISFAYQKTEEALLVLERPELAWINACQLQDGCIWQSEVQNRCFAFRNHQDSYETKCPLGYWLQ